MQRHEWEKSVADQRPLQKEDPQKFVKSLAEREARWFRKARFRPNKETSPELSYTELPDPLACIQWDDRVQYLCAEPHRRVHLHLADHFGELEREHVEVKGGREAVLLKLYQLTTRDPPAQWKTPPLFVWQAQGKRLI